MRIHSSFDHSTRHSQRGRRAAGGQTYRQLLRLLVAMVLVIAVMRQAANPRIYEVFFTAPPAAVEAALTGPPPAMAEPAVTGGSATEAADGETQLAIDRTVAAQDESTNKRLMQLLAEARREGRLPADDDLQEELIAPLQAIAAAAGLAAADPVPWTQLQAALDRWAVQQVDSAAVWKASDTPAFYRLLEDPAPTWLSRENGVQASVTALLQQPETYLHRRIVVPATVARAIQRPAAENPFGIRDYWELWLRPRDGSDHPLVLFTHQVTPEIAQVPADAALLDGPAVWTDGVYLKRLAHRSASGGELSPALVGKVHSLAAEVAAKPAEPDRPAPSGWLLVMLAAVIGLTAALWIAVQNRRQAERLRALRRAAIESRPQLPQILSEDHGDRSGGSL